MLECSTVREYHYVTLPMSWDEAKNYCRSNYSDLASALNDEQYQLLYQIAGDPVRRGWIGLHHIAYNWSWTMEDKNLYSYADDTFLKWTNPPMGDARQCASFQGGHWLNTFCRDELRVVCQNAGKGEKIKS